MTRFEKYLTEIGYVRHLWGEPTNRYNYSSLVDVWYDYVKDGKTIKFGLNQKGYPPTLIHPRPKIKMTVECKPIHTKQGHTVYRYAGVERVIFNKIIKSDIIEINEFYDTAVIRYLEENSPEDVYKEIKGGEEDLI